MNFFFDVDLTLKQILLIRYNFYKLKQVVRNWHEKCVKKFRKLNFEQIATNSCLFRYKKRDILFLIYVDNIQIVFRFIDEINQFRDALKKMFKIKNLRKIKKIFDIKITRNRKKRTLRINQIHYLSEMFDKFHMNIDKHEFIKFFINDYDAFRSIESKNYQHKINKLIYVAIHIRSNIFFYETIQSIF